MDQGATEVSSDTTRLAYHDQRKEQQENLQPYQHQHHRNRSLQAVNGVSPLSAASHTLPLTPKLETPTTATPESPLSGAEGSQNGNVAAGTKRNAPDTPTDGSGKPKQKRNKPTLSCEECVERKTKCDRGRPTCLACIKRQSDCRYTHVANAIRNAKENGSSSASRIVSKPPQKLRKASHALEADNSSPVMKKFAPRTPVVASIAAGSPFLASNVPLSKPTPSNVFGIGQQHPFANYWTCSGGLPEVVGVLPSKDQADILVAKYFECVDPVYPFIHKRMFYTMYEKFWASPQSKKHRADADLLALHFTLYALGTQFMPFPSYGERTQSAEFYASAANQALRIYSYLNRASMRSIAAMLLLGYFLMNDNHASDAYAWAGILLRQAYAMRLHRDPDLVMPDMPAVEKHTRRKYWQAVSHQDTFLTILLKLPPTATHSDVSQDALQDESQYNCNITDTFTGSIDRVENLMSINVIAPQDSAPTPPLLPQQLVDPTVDKHDVEYIKAMWKLANLVQETMSSPLSLSLPMCSSPRHKTSLVSSFRSLYRSCSSALTNLDYVTLQTQSMTNPRFVRQNLFLTSNYHHCMMLLQANENPSAGVECNVRGALEAAHEAIWAYFKLYGLFENDAGVWWVFQHRAFEEALTIADLLTAKQDGQTVDKTDPLYVKCKDDVHRMLDLVDRSRGSVEMKKTRRSVLQTAYERMIE
ncbi:hypothetical protein AAFC00_002296 [Neodothiora populina]|uniref:Zn(2)-C6 fungal-type domain-containing protein n=1 Tax=Neodothiora populina TaxID=2781224 RepID=A0ABR3PH12_9PEZI